VTFSDEREWCQIPGIYYQTYMKSDKAFLEKCMRAMVFKVAMSNFIGNIHGSGVAGQNYGLRNPSSKNMLNLSANGQRIQMSLISDVDN